jgi:NADH dehydrogenase
VVIVGGGFGGLSAAKALVNTEVDVTLIDRTNHHLFQPLLYQVATAALSPGDIAQPIRSILRSARNVHVVLATVTDIDASQRTVVTSTGTYAYDALILAPGARHSYFGHDAWETHAPGLKDMNDALHIRERILRTFEEANHQAAAPEARPALTFVVVGGGPTGVELAGAIAEIALRTMLPDFPLLTREDVRVVLVEGGPRVLSTFSASQSSAARAMLERLGVEVLLNATVTDVSAEGVRIGEQFIRSQNLIWAAGNAASPLLRTLRAECDRAGRVMVDAQCRVPGHPDVFVIGDGAHFATATGPLPGVAQVAMQQGRFVARLIRRGEREASSPAGGDDASASFRYRDYGSMATIGRAKAIAEIFGVRTSGFVAWVIWAGLHILQLISFRNRLKVLVEWMWYYVSYQPGARLILRDKNGRPA